MQGTVISYRRGKRTQNPYQVVVEVEGVSTKEKAAGLVGKKAVWQAPKKKFHGKVVSPHGSRGTVRVRFESKVPGQILGKTLVLDGDKEAAKAAAPKGKKEKKK